MQFRPIFICFRSPSPPSRTGRRLSPLSQRLSLVNPQALLAPDSSNARLPPNVQDEGVDPLAPSEPDLMPPGEDQPPFGVIPASSSSSSLALKLPFLPAGPSFTSRPPPSKTAGDLEYEKAVANFLKKNEEKKSILGDHEGTKRKKRTFTDYPVYDDDRGQGNNSNAALTSHLPVNDDKTGMLHVNYIKIKDIGKTIYTSKLIW